MPDTYSLSELQIKYLNDCIDNLMETCQIYRIPMFLTIAIANDLYKTTYRREVIGPHSHHIRLHDDQIERHIKIADGFVAVPPREVLTMDMETRED